MPSKSTDMEFYDTNIHSCFAIKSLLSGNIPACIFLKISFISSEFLLACMPTWHRRDSTILPYPKLFLFITIIALADTLLTQILYFIIEYNSAQFNYV